MKLNLELVEQLPFEIFTSDNKSIERVLLNERVLFKAKFQVLLDSCR